MAPKTQCPLVPPISKHRTLLIPASNPADSFHARAGRWNPALRVGHLLGCRLRHPFQHGEGACDHAGDIRKTGRHDHGVVGFGQVAELQQVMFGDPQVDRLKAVTFADSLGDLPDAGRGGFGN